RCSTIQEWIKEDEEPEPGGFNTKKVWQRILVILAGPMMNFVLAIFLVAGFYLASGVVAADENGNYLISSQIDSVVEGGAAEQAGLQPGDLIVAIDGQAIENCEDVHSMTASAGGQELIITIERNGQNQNVAVTPVPQEGGGALIGISPEYQRESVNVGQALLLGTQYTFDFCWYILKFIGQAIGGSQSLELGGPVRIVSEIGTAVNMGWDYLIGITVALSIDLGLFNLFPIPAFDGSRILFLLVEGIRRKPLDPKKENYVHMLGFLFLMGFIMLVTCNDVASLFGESFLW
ncbi:MAG: RIP metalloprotease RseP, partial [Clostridia bacterium]|nr:RIP metalloprotease RseP [Clostridia bacterium]